MADLSSYEMGHDLGVNTVASSRTGTSATRKAWPVAPGGNQLEGDISKVDIPTEHKTKGNRYSVLSQRNSQSKTISGPYFPSLGEFINYAGTNEDFRQAGGLPVYLHQRTCYGDGTLGVAVSGNSTSDLGEDKLGVMVDGFSFDLDRNGGDVISLQLTAFLNQDKRLAGATSTSGDTETAGSNVVFTLADASDFTVGDVVDIVDADNSVTTQGTITVISTNDVTIGTLADDVDGSSTALVFTKTLALTADSFPSDDPYPQTNTFIDVDINKTGWTGDRADAQRASIQFSNALNPKSYTSNVNPDLNQSWTKIVDGTQTATGSVELVAAEDAYFDIKRAPGIKKIRLRHMGYSGEGDTTTTNGALTYSAPATTTTVTVLDTTDFLAGQYILLNDGTNQCVVKINTVTNGTSMVCSAIDCDIADGATVYNTAWEVKILDAAVSSTPKTPDEENYIVTVNYDATTDALIGEIVQTKGYNHVFA